MKSNKCPICEKNNLQYGSVDFDGNQIYYPWECSNCGSTGQEWYELVFIEHTHVEEKYNGR